jgi:RNA polymerase sigma-70 factor (ECF subfamily)
MVGSAQSFAITDTFIATLRFRLIGFARGKGCGDDSEDLAQAALVILLREYPLVTDSVDCIKLSITITRNLILNWRRLKHQGNIGLDQILQPASKINLEEEFFKKELLSAIEGLGDRCKTLFHLRLGGLSSSDVAAKMNMPGSGAVDVAYFRCLQTLRERIRGKHAK